jgi:hypothetical protein
MTRLPRSRSTQPRSTSASCVARRAVEVDPDAAGEVAVARARGTAGPSARARGDPPGDPIEQREQRLQARN